VRTSKNPNRVPGNGRRKRRTGYHRSVETAGRIVVCSGEPRDVSPGTHQCVDAERCPAEKLRAAKPTTRPMRHHSGDCRGGIRDSPRTGKDVPTNSFTRASKPRANPVHRSRARGDAFFFALFATIVKLGRRGGQAADFLFWRSESRTQSGHIEELCFAASSV